MKNIRSVLTPNPPLVKHPLVSPIFSLCLALVCGALALNSAYAQNGTWTNLTGGSWTNTNNWSGGIIATNTGNTADFSTLTLGSAPTVTLDGARTIGNLIFGDAGNAYGWNLNTGSGGPLTLAVSSGSPTINVNNQTMTIGAVLAGTAGLTKMGNGTLKLSGANTYSGNTYVSNGIVTYSGSGGSSGAGTLYVAPAANNIAVVNLGSSGTENFYSTFNIGAVATSAGAVNQTAGTVNALNNSGYIQLGGSTTGYGSYVLSGGTLNIPGAGGIRIGYAGLGSFVQSGGFFNCGRYISLGGSSSSGNGVATFTGGGTLVASGYRILVPDSTGTAAFNVGTEAGGTAVITNLNTTGLTMEASAGGNGVFNLNSGTLQLAGPVYRANLTAGSFVAVNFNGGTLQAGGASFTLLASSITNATVYNGGLVVDSLANTATFSGPLLGSVGNGVYPAGGSFAISSSGGAGYIGAPLVAVTTDGSGTGATAIANVSGGAVTGVTMTCPGQNYAAGDTLTFTFTGSGYTAAASTFVYTLTANDLSVNSIGGLTKNSSGTLNLTVANSYTGNTVVNGGTLNVTADGGLGAGNVMVANGATLTLSSGVTNNYLASTANLLLGASAIANLNFTGTNTVNGLSFDGGATYVAVGTYGSSSSPAANQNALFTGTGVINVTAQPTGATVALASSLNPAEVTQSVTFTATVSGSGGLPTGTVTFKDGAVTLGIVSLNGSGVATFTSSVLAMGTHTITANYNGNSTYGAAAATPLAQVINPHNDIWSGAVNNVWDINTTANWLDLGVSAVYHDNDLAQLDDTATGSTAITLGVPVSPYGVIVTNNLKNYSISGAGAISGTASLALLGTGTLTISNANTYAGNTTVQGGTLNYNGTSAYNGNGTLNVGGSSGAGVLNINSSGTFAFSGSGNGTSVGGIAGDSADTGNGAINQVSGTVNLGIGYLELGSGDAGGSAASYGCYNLTGGTLNTVNASGVRVGASGYGVFRQTGGIFTSSRWFAIGSSTGGGAGAGTGEATFIGGSATIGSGYRVIVGDKPGATAVLNLGTEAGGNAMLAALYNSGGNCLELLDNSGTANLNLNSGTLQLAGAIYPTAAGGTVNLNGGTLQAANNANLISDSLLSYVFNGGVIIDSQGYTVTNAASMLAAVGPGIYPGGGSFTVASGGGSGYIGAPLVTVSGGSGFGAMAIANISGGVVTSVTMTCPGQYYQAGDMLSFAFSGGGTATPASTFNYTLQVDDVVANGTGGLTKVGSGTLVLNGNSSYTGPTFVNAGTLVVGTYVAGAGSYAVTSNSVLDVAVAYAGAQLNMSRLTFASPTTNTLTLDLTATGGSISASAAPVNVSSNVDASGITTINLLISGISVGQYPLIQYGGSLTGTGSFALGIVPIGVAAHLVTNTVTTPNSIDLVVTSSGQPRWNGLLPDNVTQDGNWDITTTTNWVDALTSQAEVYKEGQPVLFDDNAGYVNGTTTVNLVANVHPGSVTFNNGSYAYTLGGANKISGATGLTVQGYGSVTIQNALNDYIGVTTVGGGTLNITNLANGGQPSAIGAATADPANLMFTNGGNLNYSGPATIINRGYTVGAGGGTLALNADVTLSGSAMMTNSGSFTKSGPATLTYTGAGVNQLGATNNIAAGTVVLDGSAGSQSNSVTGLMLVGSAGPATTSLVVTNSSLSSSQLTVNYGTASLLGNSTLNNPNTVYIGGAYGTGVLNLNSTGTSSLATNLTTASTDQGFFIGGTGSAGDSGAGAVNQTTGAVNLGWPGANNTYLELGSGGASAYGSYNLSGGSILMSVTSGGGSGIRVGNGGMGSYVQSGGTNYCSRYFAIGGGSTGNGVVTFTGGTANITNTYRFLVPDAAATAVLNIGTEAGGTAVINHPSTTGLTMNNSSGGTGTLNLNGGILQLGARIFKNNGTGTVVRNYNGGTLQALGSITFLDNINTIVDTVYNGGLTLDSQTNTPTWCSASLTAATGNGIYPSGGTFTISSGGGAGYIGAPLVTVSGGSGTGAMAIATVTNGVVTNVVLTCPGQNYVVGDNVSFAFAGGGYASAATTFVYTLQAADVATNTSGGLIKLGSGQLIVNGTTNTYTGITYVNNGELQIRTTSALGSTAGKTVVANGAQLCAGGGGALGTVGENIDLNGDGTGSSGALQVNDAGTTVTWGGNITLVTDSGVGGADNFTISGPIGGGGTLSKLSANTVTISGISSYTGATVVSNGTLSVTGSLLGSGAVAIDSGATLGGNGIIAGAVTVNSNATLAAGTSLIGTLSIGNTLTFAPGATNFARLNKSTAANDSVVGLTQVNYAGTLVVANLAGTLAVGDKFTLFSAATRTGSFATLNLPALATGLGWSNSLAIDGSIQVVTAVNLNPTNLTFMISGNMMTLSWPADHLGWHLQYQTNSLATGLNTNWVTIPGSDTITSTNIPINPADPTVFYRMVYP